MFENLTNSDVLILSGLIGVIIVIGIICIILTIKGGKSSSSKKIVNEEKSNIPEPDIHIALATENIPAIESAKEKEKEEQEQMEIFNRPVEMEEIIIMEEPIIIPAVEDNMVEFPSYETKTEPSYTPSYTPVYEEEYVSPSINTKLEEVQDAKNGASIEEVLSAMQGDLENHKYETIDRYEEEQEENAVISYQELLNRKMTLNNEEIIKEELEEEKASSNYLDELPNFKDIVLEPIPDRNADRPFMNSEFVSPIFGRLSSNTDYPTVKKTVEIEELVQTELISDGNFDMEDENDEFLNTLKEFRRNL